MTHPYKHKHQ